MFQALQGVEGEETLGISQLSDEDNLISSSLGLTSPDIFKDLVTLVEQETKGNKEERTNLYRQSSPMKRLTPLRHSPSTISSKQPKRAKRKDIEGQSTLTKE